jgi:hypothetical protein
MVGILFFWLFFLSALTVMFQSGERVEQRFALFLLSGVIVTYVLNLSLGWDGAQFSIMLINLSVLVFALFLIALTERHWPIWFSGLHSITVATDIAQLTFPNNLPALYTNLQGFWFFPAVTIMVIGIMLDNKTRNSTV